MLLADLGLHSADESPAQEDPQHLAESTLAHQSTPNIRVATVASSCEEERKPLIPRVSS
jgi:hypothetical protein